MSSYVCLVDADNFFVSCERIFQPLLKNKPVAVLSNNDGCIIARSNEVKSLGIQMGAPLFKVANLVRYHDIQILSANFSLYSAISERVYSELHKYSAKLEKYSIDEYFFDVPVKLDLANWLKGVKSSLERSIGIPLTFGLSLNKTLAKIATHHAKVYRNGCGYKVLVGQKAISQALAITDIKDVWGIGRKLTKYYRKLSVSNCEDLVSLSPDQVRKKSGISGLKTYYELKGMRCHSIKEATSPDKILGQFSNKAWVKSYSKSSPKSCMVSRTLGSSICKLGYLEEAIAQFAQLASSEIRRNNVLAMSVGVFITTDRFSANYTTISRQKSILPSFDNQKIVGLATELLRQCYNPNLSYKRAGVFLPKLVSCDTINLDLFRDYTRDEKAIRISKAMDSINARYGKNTIHMSTRNHIKLWGSRQNHLSDNYFSNGKEFVKVY